MKKVNLLIGTILILSLVFVGCGPKTDSTGSDTTAPPNSEASSTATDAGTDAEAPKAKDQVLRFIMDNDPASLDPQLCVDSNGNSMLGYMLEGLIKMDPHGKPLEGLADTWTLSEDHLVYTFHIREDAKWADGKPLTAEDVYYTWFRAIDPELAGGNAYRFFDIVGAQDYYGGTLTDKSQVGIALPGNNTFEVTLTRPTPYFYELVTNNAFRPVREDFVTANGEKFASEPELTLSNGPYILKEWKRAQQLTFEKNPNFWNADAVHIEKIVYNIIPDPQVALQMYEGGELDILALDASLISKYADNPELHKSPGTNIAFTAFNTKDAFMKNQKLRLAFSMIMDRDAFTDKVLKNGSRPMRGFVPYGFPGIGDKDFRTVSGDHITDISMDASKYSAEAKALLDTGLSELGESKEALSSHLSILVFDEEGKKQAQVMQELYKKYFDIDCAIDQLTLKVIIDRMFAGDYSQLVIGFGGFYIDPLAYLENYTSTSPMNTSAFSDPAYDALIDEARGLTGEARVQKFIEAEAYLLEQAPIAPTYNRAGNILIKPYVKQYDVSSIYGSDIVNVYIAEH